MIIGDNVQMHMIVICTTYERPAFGSKRKILYIMTAKCERNGVETEQKSIELSHWGGPPSLSAVLHIF